MISAPYGFRGDIGGAKQAYVRFKSSCERPLNTITINFETKEFHLKTENPGEPKRLYKVDLKDLHKHWPLRVGISGHLNTTIEMVCFFLSSKIISTKRKWWNLILVLLFVKTIHFQKVNQFCSVKPAKRG